MSEGLEGKSNNLVALLLDTLLRPNTDIGEQNPSSLCWKHDPSRAISHVIIGRGNPGGSWQYMNPDIKTLSLGQWLELPLYSFEEWKSKQEVIGKGTLEGKHVRAFIGEITAYYSDYVTEMGLEKNFISDAQINRVSNLKKRLMRSSSSQCTNSQCVSPPCCSSSPLLFSPASPSTTLPVLDASLMIANEWEEFVDKCMLICCPEDCGVYCQESKWQRRIVDHTWHVKGYCNETTNINVYSEKLVLACGVSGTPRRLDVPGEDVHYLCHEFTTFAKKIHACSQHSFVVIVGAGLSAADAILLALRKEINVIHVFHQDPYDQRLIFNRIPETAYQGYNYVFRLMQGRDKIQNYICCAQSKITEFQESGFSLVNKTGKSEIWRNVSLGAVLIGTDAELGFLPKDLVPKLGMCPGMPINAKHNPVEVNQFSFVTEASSSLYAIGSLVGDNFVRFGVGSALGAAQHILGLKV